MRKSACLAALLASCALTAPALADINVGITLSVSGPASALGIPEKNAIAHLPTKIAGETVNWIVFDDATDPTIATKNARKLVTENNADILVGSSATPASVAIAEVANETKTPLIAVAPIDLPANKNTWVFRAPQHISLMAKALIENMKTRGIKEVGFIGYSDGYGESWLKEMTPLLEASGMKFTAIERYNRADTSVTGQVLKLVAANPQAVLIVGSGTPAALPQAALSERGYKGQVYQTHGAVSRDFLRVAGKTAEGTIFPVGPVVVASQLPAGHPSKALSLAFIEAYEKVNGAGSFASFAGHMYDAGKQIEAAVPVALKKAKPGTPEFRAALRDALEGAKDVVNVHGIITMSPTDHFGHDARSRVLIKVENGDWKLLSAQ
ncbi:MAG: ABC transporter substrate-binding protein [Xanthobacteraceae bacterium]|nr:MAG: ABC transporter substrate-binding protein [Xanthobacteraceae bacterium]